MVTWRLLTWRLLTWHVVVARGRFAHTDQLWDEQRGGALSILRAAVRTLTITTAHLTPPGPSPDTTGTSHLTPPGPSHLTTTWYPI